MRDHRNIPSRMSAMDVLGNQDLLKLIFLGNVSPSMHAALRRVCKGFRDLLVHPRIVGILNTLLGQGFRLVRPRHRRFAAWQG